MAGRPTDYSPEMLERAGQYLKEYEEFGDAVPSIVGLASALGVGRSSLYRWAERDDAPEFRDMLDAVLEIQEKVALSKGLRSEFNPTIVKLLLAKHGYHDKAAFEHSGPDGGPVAQKLEIEFVNPGSDS